MTQNALPFHINPLFPVAIAVLLQGILVSVSDEGRFVLDDGTGTISLSISNDFRLVEWKTGQFSAFTNWDSLQAEEPIATYFPFADKLSGCGWVMQECMLWLLEDILSAQVNPL